MGHKGGKLSDGQRRLQLVPPRTGFLDDDAKLSQSVVALTQNLVAVPSQGGADRQQAVIEVLSDWYEATGLSYDVVRAARRKPENSYLGLTATVGSGRPPFYLLTACLDTAPFGDRRNWSYDPASGRLDSDGWLHGRGSADSKVGVAMFSHLLADLRRRSLNGTIVFLADSDEHTGGFGAIKSVVSREEAKKFKGAYIGYPGTDSIKSGARGFYRSRITFFGTSQHTGSRKIAKDDAILKALSFCEWISQNKVSVEYRTSSFPVSPKITVTSINGGTNSFSITSDLCYVRVDVRLTPDFQKADARQFISKAVKHATSCHEGQKPKIANEQSWPAYQISNDSPLVARLLEAASKNFNLTPVVEVCGPSNVGNYLASVGVDAVCGFGVEHKGIHQANEKINTASILPVYKSYREAILNLV